LPATGSDLPTSAFRRDRRVGNRLVSGFIGGADIGETAVKPAAELFWVEFLLRAALARNHHARRGHPR
jgi:hypothetical protein